MSDPLRVTVVGAGLGGLAAAASLLRRGFDVTVIEQADELGEIGAGVQLSPNAMKVLRALGLEAAAIAVGFEPDRHVVRSHRTGRILAQTPLKGTLSSSFGAGYYGFHRSDLHRILQSAVPAGVVRLGARCTGVRTEGDHAVVELADGTRHAADVVVGADGVHSVVRARLLGPEAPRFTGNVCWRGLVPAKAMPPGAIPPDMTVWFGPGASFIAYYVRRGEMINWVAMCEADAWKSESWKLEGDRREVMERYAAWHPTVRELIARSELYLKWALLDRDPLPRWSEGRVTLLGDAAHPMLPYLAQGACMAIEDGYSVAAHLAQSTDDVAAALAAYENDRRGRTARVQLLARARAIENHLDSPWARLRRNVRYALQRLGDPKRHTYRIEWIYGHDVTAG
ncbi:MAG TPA: FAD-dependent monooxygenase [Caldimonas sp.]|nr:FAD-dependent monooxygenase [Caldimonas sp.]HEV7574925.1 FAD-dependent monooxygenase [Caldimonas sp.]